MAMTKPPSEMTVKDGKVQETTGNIHPVVEQRSRWKAREGPAPGVCYSAVTLLCNIV